MKKKKFYTSLLSLLMAMIMIPVAPVSAAEHEHTYEVKVVKQYTCTTAGMEKHICSCGDYYFEQVPAHHTEEFKTPYEKEPTCGETGIADVICAKCGETLETGAEVPATGKHDFKEGTRPATCTVPERVGKICSVCGQADGEFEENGKPLGHDWGTPTVKAATCEASGESVSTCQRGDCNEKKTEIIPPLGHSWKSNGVTEADCEHGAGEIFICNNGCGKIDVIEFTEPGLAVPALGHKWVTDAAVEATCEGIGYTPYHCEREGCGETTKSAIVPALGHKMKENVVKPTCQDKGYTVSGCAVCGYVSDKYNEKDVDSNAHVLTQDSVIVPATCTTNGLMALKCSLCEKTEFEDDEDFEFEGEDINTKKRYKVIPAAHTWDDGETTDATCTQAGVTVYTCKVDECKTTSEVAIAPLGHATEEAIVATATCGEAGEKNIVCTRECCKVDGKNLVLVTGIAIQPTGKHDIKDITKEPTCTDVGKVGYGCSVCGQMDGEWFEYAPALGHEWEKDDENSIAPSCTAAGVIVEKCSRDNCGATRSAADPIINHNWEAEDVLDADCVNPQRVLETCSMCEATQETVVVDKNGNVTEPAKGHTAVTGATVEPSCVSGGYVEMSCSVCSTTWAAAETTPLGHNIKDEVVPANCKDRGYTSHKCTRCDYSEGNTDYTPINPNAHVRSVTILKEQKCDVNGVQKVTCAKCGTSMGYESIPAGHKWDEGIVSEAATCTEDGIMKLACASCEAVTAEAIVATGHVENITASQPATCVKPGWKESTCTKCGEDLGKNEVEPTGIHKFKDDQMKEATCTEPLKVGRLCEMCGMPESEESYQILGDPLGHDLSKLNDKEHTQIVSEAACGVSGEAVISCLNEGCDLTQSAVIPALEHDFDVDPDDLDPRPATCVSPSYMVEYCQNESCEVTRAAVVKDSEALGHSWAVLEEKPATCTVDAVTVYECTREGCGLTREAVSTGSALNHDLTTVSVEPNCQDEGYTTQKCTRCDYEGEHTNVVPAVANAHVAKGVNPPLKPADCENIGVRKLVCEFCGKAMGYESIPASHAWGNETIEKAATCTQEGVKAMTCEKCGTASKAAIEAAGHDCEEKVTQQATCGKNGKKSIVCKVCGDVQQKDISIPATGKHSYTDDNFLDPTCTEPGKVGTICSVCGAVDGEYFPFGEALGHDWDKDNPEIVSEAACEVSGVGVIHCKRKECEATMSAVIPALEHDYEYPEDGSGYHDADCEHGDYSVGVCKNCGDELIEEIGLNEALGHSWVTAEAVEANCVSGGYVIIECTREGCGATKQAAETEALGHIWKETVIPPNCKNEGYTADVCQRCGEEGEHTNIIASGEALHVAVSGEALREANCKSGGVRKLVCAGCGKGMGYESIPKTDHTWGEADVTKAPTCTETGEKTVTCDVCGATETQEIPATGHDVDMDNAYFDDDTTALWFKCKNCDYVVFDPMGFEMNPGAYKPFDWITQDHEENHELMLVTDEAVAPTETTEGKTEGSHCKVCGQVIVEQTTIPATGPVCDHEYEEAGIEEDENGVLSFKYECKHCHTVYYEAL